MPEGPENVGPHSALKSSTVPVHFELFLRRRQKTWLELFQFQSGENGFFQRI